MSERQQPPHRRDYSPFNRTDDYANRLPELFAVLVAGVGLYFQGDLLGAAAGITVAVLWTRLQVEFVFATGVVLLAGLGGDSVTSAAILTMAGLAGLLAAELGRAWESIRLAVLYLAVFAAASVGIVYLTADVALHWVAAIAVAVIAAVSYGLHRYEQYRLESTNATSPTSIPDDRRSEDA